VKEFRENLAPGHAILAIPNDSRTCWAWPVNYRLGWEQAEIVGPASSDDEWIVHFRDAPTAVLPRGAFMRLSYHVQAYGAGQALMDTGILSDMGKYADCYTWGAADEATQHMFDDARVDSVEIGQYVQETRGMSWRPLRHLKIVPRAFRYGISHWRPPAAL
jgi:hypothetical protein